MNCFYLHLCCFLTLVLVALSVIVLQSSDKIPWKLLLTFWFTLGALNDLKFHCSRSQHTQSIAATVAVDMHRFKILNVLSRSWFSFAFLQLACAATVCSLHCCVQEKFCSAQQKQLSTYTPHSVWDHQVCFLYGSLVSWWLILLHNFCKFCIHWFQPSFKNAILVLLLDRKFPPDKLIHRIAYLSLWCLRGSNTPQPDCRNKSVLQPYWNMWCLFLLCKFACIQSFAAVMSSSTSHCYTEQSSHWQHTNGQMDLIRSHIML